jgi:hypothetical protein
MAAMSAIEYRSPATNDGFLSRIEIGEVLLHPQPAALSERQNQIIVMGAGDRRTI